MRLYIALFGSVLLVPALSRPQKFQGGGSWGVGNGFRGGFGGVIVEDGVAHGASGTFNNGGSGGFAKGMTFPATFKPGKSGGTTKGSPKTFNFGPAGSGGVAKGPSGGTFNFGPTGQAGKQSPNLFGQPRPQLPTQGTTQTWQMKETQVRT
jgi:hypothetical protein